MKTLNSAKIYQFPRRGRTNPAPICPSGNSMNASKDSKQAHKTAGWNKKLHWPIGLVWLLAGMLWPFLNWMGAMDVLFQCLRALYYSNTPAVHATLQAGIHTASYLLLSAFVYLYRPNVS
jgi:Uncharacterized KleE stable inheritance protein